MTPTTQILPEALQLPGAIPPLQLAGGVTVGVGVGVLQLMAQKPFEHLMPDLQVFPCGQKPPISHSVHSSLIHWLQYFIVPSEY